MDDTIEPLPPSLWFERIQKIANGRLGSVENALRHASHLLQLTPQPFREVVRLNTSEAQFEALLEAGSFDAAARHLIGQPTALSVKAETSENKYRATIGCSLLGRPISGFGNTEACAILDAWTACLLTLKSDYEAEVLNSPHQHEHRSPAG